MGGMGWGVGWLGGPWPMCWVIIVSTPVLIFGFWDYFDLVLTKGQDLGPVRTGDWGLGLGLDNND